jgi:mono/diheme cytochrome c family protein
MKKTAISSFLLIILGCCLSAESPVTSVRNNSIRKGKTVYVKYCLSCHQQDGSGVPAMNPSLRRNHFVTGKGSKVIQVVLHGLNGVEIDDNDYSNTMPSFENVLKDQQIADVLNYVRSNFGNRSKVLINASNVKHARSHKPKTP